MKRCTPQETHNQVSLWTKVTSNRLVAVVLLIQSDTDEATLTLGYLISTQHLKAAKVGTPIHGGSPKQGFTYVLIVETLCEMPVIIMGLFIIDAGPTWIWTTMRGIYCVHTIHTEMMLIQAKPHLLAGWRQSPAPEELLLGQ
ncbi:hypothetical protein E2C01_026717 [Portunus trituberculatus]|uniref:Uncharacterized protein n=1 Tax=Portunus trituberculatus TaxID=210409 RepID=A0A5B7EJP1_PORTR|nr:hypothetical protein [Portunus trituberculatus]